MTVEYETVTEEVPDGRLEFVDAGHFPHFEEPSLVTAAIRRFLASLDDRAQRATQTQP